MSTFLHVKMARKLLNFVEKMNLILCLLLVSFVYVAEAQNDSVIEEAEPKIQRMAEGSFGRYFSNPSRVHKMRRMLMRCRRRFRHSRHRWGRRRDGERFRATMRKMKQVNGPAETTAEAIMSEYLYQGDILLSEDQATAILNEVTANSTDSEARAKRQAYNLATSKWDVTKPIYVEYYNISTATTAMVRDSLSFWQNNTCLTFVESTTLEPRLRFIKGVGCWSLVGKSRTVKVQDISIGAGCEFYRTICHEIGHALGMFHHQARYDRDDYVTIVAENIKDSQLDQYNKQTEATLNTYGVGYDVGSVMHYKQREFAKASNLISILAKSTEYQSSIASERWPSFADVKVINKHLCSSKCTNILTCENFGYVDPKNCNQCRCPDGFTGTTCGRRHPGNGPQAWQPSCGADLVAVATWTEMNITIGDSTNTVYKSVSNCFWIIRAPPGRTLQSYMTRSPSAVCTDSCETQGVRVTATTPETTAATYCCGNALPRNLTTTSDVLIFELYTYQGIADARVWYRLTPM